MYMMYPPVDVFFSAKPSMNGMIRSFEPETQVFPISDCRSPSNVIRFHQNLWYYLDMYHLGYVHSPLDVVNSTQVWPKNGSIRSKRLKELHCSQSVRVAGSDIHGAPPYLMW